MSDIVERLIKEGVWRDTFTNEFRVDPLCKEAADEIESLRQRVKELENENLGHFQANKNMLETMSQQRKELAALKQSQDKPVAYLVYSPTRHEQEFLYEDELGYEEGSEITPLYTSAPTIPEGWQLVPIEPTDIHFVQIYMREHGLEVSEWMVKTMHHALLAAAPKPEDVK